MKMKKGEIGRGKETEAFEDDHGRLTCLIGDPL